MITATLVQLGGFLLFGAAGFYLFRAADRLEMPDGEWSESFDETMQQPVERRASGFDPAILWRRIVGSLFVVCSGLFLLGTLLSWVYFFA